MAPNYILEDLGTGLDTAASSLLDGYRPELNTDRRSHSRHELDHEIWLLDPARLNVVRAHAINISELGLYGSLPAGFGLAVGQRYEVRIAPHSLGDSVPRHIVS